MLHQGAKVDMRIEVKLAGIGLKIPPQRVMAGVICCLRIEFIKGEIFVLGEGLGGNYMCVSKTLE